jgi:hypothetical protein
MVMMHIKDILRDFNKYADARKNFTLRTKLVFVFCSATIAMVLFFSYQVVNNAMNKILVVNEGGEFVRFRAVRQDLLYESLLKSHCAFTAYYLNSFDRLSLQENRARALFLVDKGEANAVFAKYQADRAYGDALEPGCCPRHGLCPLSPFVPSLSLLSVQLFPWKEPGTEYPYRFQAHSRSSG